MKDSERGATPCPWCGAAVPVSRKSFPGVGEEGPFLRCGCGGIGLATIEPEVDRLRVAEELRQDPDLGPKILEPIEVFGVDDFADSAVVIKARLKTHPIQQWNVGREYRRRLKKAFDAEGIEIPFPHTSIYMGEASKPFQVLLKEAAATSGTAE